jgi:transposase
VVAHVPWAAHDAGHTHTFDQQVAWLAVRTSKSAVSELMRIGWRTVGSIVDRVYQQMRSSDLSTGRDGLDGLRRIGGRVRSSV